MRLQRVVATVMFLSGTAALAADHADGPRAISEPAADLTDIFAWMSPDASRLNLIMDVFPNAPAGAVFSDAVEYVFHIDSMPAFGGVVTSRTVACVFDTQQSVTCTMDAESVTGDASGSAGISNTSGSMTVFTGRRDDPFFFNLAGFQAAAADVVAASPTLTLDAAACPSLDSTTADALVSQLGQSPDGGSATNTFAGQSVLSLVVQIDKSLVNVGGPVLGVWASTRGL